MRKKENIFLRKDGRFEARYAKGRNENGKLIYGFCYGRTYEEARNKLLLARKALETSTGCTDHRSQTFSYYSKNWLSTNSLRLKASTRAKYQADIENHINPFFGEQRPDEITSEKIDNFTHILLYEKQLSAKAVRNILALFHSIYMYIGKRGAQTLPNPEIIYPKEPKKIVRVLDRNEEKLLTLYLAREMDLCKFGVYIALRTGLRIGEVCALRWKDISMNAHTISIRHTEKRKKNPDQQDKFKTKVVIGSPKSYSSCRTIPLMPDIAVLCDRFFPDNPESFVLTGTNQCMEPRKLQRRLKTYTEDCSIQEIHFHTLRHTFATRCIEVGFDVKTLSEILGHSNTSITLNQYVHPNLDQKRENMNRLKTMIYF